MYKLLHTFACLFICFSLVLCDLNKEENVCEWDGVKGKCVSATKCLTTLDNRGPERTPCPHEGEEKLICCTDCELVNDTRNAVFLPTGGLLWKDGRKFRDQCLNFLKDLPHHCLQAGYYGGVRGQLDDENKCHMYSIWAVGGAPPANSVPPSKNPYEALMGFGEDQETALWLTSGAIISERFILTAAHGYDNITTGSHPVKFAALGVKNRQEDKQNWQIHVVKKIHQNPHYNGETRYNDIAVLELETPYVMSTRKTCTILAPNGTNLKEMADIIAIISFNKDVLPACLPDPYGKFIITTGQTTSWKDQSSDAKTFLDTPNTIQVPQISAKECDRQLFESENPNVTSLNSLFPSRINDTIQVCYGQEKEKPCLNVVGSPIVVDTQLSHCMHTVVGVNTLDYECGTAVYTKVSPYLGWIESIVWPAA